MDFMSDFVVIIPNLSGEQQTRRVPPEVQLSGSPTEQQAQTHEYSINSTIEFQQRMGYHVVEMFVGKSLDVLIHFRSNSLS